MDDQGKFWKMMAAATSLRQLPASAPTHDANGDEDWEPAIILYQQKASQRMLLKQAKERTWELYRDVHTRTRMKRWATFKINSLERFLFMPLLQVVAEDEEDLSNVSG